MRTLYLALYAEGSTDDRFLSPVIERTVERIALKHVRERVDLVPILLAKPTVGNSGAELIREAARIARNCNLMIIHTDADAPETDGALSSRYRPGRQLVMDMPETEAICRTLVPIIPVRMTEAWMLADIPTVLAQIETHMSEKQLRNELKARKIQVPTKPQHVGTIFDPKDVLEQIVRITRTNHRITRQDLYEPVGQNIDLDQLGKVPEYKQFVDDIIKGLEEIHVLPNRQKNISLVGK